MGVKKNMKQKPESEPNDNKAPSTLGRDFTGLLLIGFAVFSLAALASFSPGDPSFNNFVSTEVEAKNLGGRVGACLADGLAQVFGAGAFFFPGIMALLGWAVIRGQAFPRWRVVLGFGALFMVAFCSLLYVQFPGDPWFGSAAYAGGMTGAYIGPYLITWLNVSGAQLVLGIFLTICLFAMFNISVNRLVDGTKQGIRNMFSGLANGAKSAGQGLSQGAFSAGSRFMEWRNILRQAKEERNRVKLKNVEPVIVARTPEISRREPPAPPVLKKKTVEKLEEKFPEPEETFATEEYSRYRVPPLDLLNDPQEVADIGRMREEIIHNSQVLERKLADFGIEGKVVQVLPGPVITLYEYEPAPGIKVSRILSLTDDLALAMRAPSVRILAPVPGKSVVGIELPNPKREIVTMKEVMRSDEFSHSGSKLAMVLGKDNIGHPVVQDLAQVPHLLMAGSTGSGKSVGINAMICSILLNATPDEVKLIMIDPKMLELSMYDGIPHLIAPVVTNPKKAAAALQWAVSEMEARYKVMAEKGVRNVRGFNELVDKLEIERAEQEQKRARQVKYKKKMEPIKPDQPEPEEAEAETEEEEPLPEIPARLPYVVIIIDELADLMMVASKGVEDSLTRLAQMARAAGIHLIVATQRPSVDVLTGIIKANFPARISYQVTSRVDSRTILDSMGAEKLLGKGDMLFLPPGTSRLRRIHGAMVSDEEVNRLLAYIKKQSVKPQYQDDVFEQAAIEEEKKVEAEEEYDELYDQALAIVARERQASISMIQRRLRIGYNRAARIIEIMERDGAVGPSDGVKPREVYVNTIPLE